MLCLSVGFPWRFLKELLMTNNLYNDGILAQVLKHEFMINAACVFTCDAVNFFKLKELYS